MKLRSALLRARRVAKAALGRDIVIRRQLRCRREVFGKDPCAWCICPHGLTRDSVVYSFGVGRDISFDLELIENFGLTVHAFDPTPGSISWVKSHPRPSQFRMHEFGLAHFDGIVRLYPPEIAHHISHSVLYREKTAANAIDVPVKRLATIARELGHTRVDLLKMDIEGAEYLALAECLDSSPLIDQLLVEFHHRMPGAGLEKTRQTLRLLKARGFLVFNVSAAGEEISFLRREP